MAMLNGAGYAKIAGVLGEELSKARGDLAHSGYGAGYHEGIQDTAIALADLFERDSKGFDRQRFFDDIGIAIPMEEATHGTSRQGW